MVATLAPGFIAGNLAAMLGSLAIAQSDLLTQAEIYKLVNRVQLLLKNQPPRSAQVAGIDWSFVCADRLRSEAEFCICPNSCYHSP